MLTDLKGNHLVTVCCVFCCFPFLFSTKKTATQTVCYGDRTPKKAGFSNEGTLGVEFWPKSIGESLKIGPRPAFGRPEAVFDAFPYKVRPKLGPKAPEPPGRSLKALHWPSRGFPLKLLLVKLAFSELCEGALECRS
jgi:hypothetical protein